MRAILAVFSAAAIYCAPLLADGGQAHAKVMCQVRSILARKAKGPTDPRLASLRPLFKRMPFSAFGSFQLVRLARLSIVKGRFGAAKLPTRKVALLTFKGAIGEGKKMRLRLHLSITTPRALRYLPGMTVTIANGGTFLVAGQKYAGGTLIVGVTCKK